MMRTVCKGFWSGRSTRSPPPMSLCMKQSTVELAHPIRMTPLHYRYWLLSAVHHKVSSLLPQDPCQKELTLSCEDLPALPEVTPHTLHTPSMLHSAMESASILDLAEETTLHSMQTKELAEIVNLPYAQACLIAHQAMKLLRPLKVALRA
eukprot:3074523-Amphidinium_carterae.2